MATVGGVAGVIGLLVFAALELVVDVPRTGGVEGPLTLTESRRAVPLFVVGSPHDEANMIAGVRASDISVTRYFDSAISLTVLLHPRIASNATLWITVHIRNSNASSKLEENTRTAWRARRGVTFRVGDGENDAHVCNGD